MPNCPYCSKAFGRISALQNHSAFCAIRHQGKYAAKNSNERLVYIAQIHLVARGCLCTKK